MKKTFTYSLDIQNKVFIIVLLVLYALPLFGQKKKFQTDSSTINSTYLSDKDYEQLMNLEDLAFENDQIELLRFITDFHIKKAKEHYDSLDIARGYYYRAVIEDDTIALAYADSIIEATKNSGHHKYPTLGYSLKADIYYNNGDYPKALPEFITAYNLATQKENVEDQITTSMAVAAIRNLNGQPYAAVDIYNRALKTLKDHTEYKYREQDYMHIMYNLSLAHIRLSQLDSARIYYGAGLTKAQNLKDTVETRDFIMLGAELNFLQKKYRSAHDTLIKYIDHYQGNKKAIKLYYLGKIAQVQKDNDLAADYFLQIDSIVSTTNEPFSDIKEVYQQLALYFSENDDQKREISFLEKLIHFDSIMASDQRGISETAVLAFDVPFLKLQKQRAENRLKTKQIWIVFLSILAGCSILIGIFLFIRTRIIKKRINKLLSDRHHEVLNPEVEETDRHLESVPEDIREDTLKKLRAFEQSDRFLDKELTMAQLADEMSKNTKYFSAIINHYKKVNFPSYIKELRIDRAIKELSTDVGMAKYNNQGLAEIFGFKTADSFSKAFREKTGVSPTKLIKELKNRKRHGHL